MKQAMKLRILTIVALLILVTVSSCTNRQFPGSYHQNGQGHARFY